MLGEIRSRRAIWVGRREGDGQGIVQARLSMDEGGVAKDS